MTKQRSELPRKRPTQQRARSTVDAIVLAAAHILRTEGSECLTTNRIAQVAGVSIGSLYQYFEAPRLRPLDPEMASFIVVRAIEAIIHGTALETPDRLGDPRFVSEVVELVARYVEA